MLEDVATLEWMTVKERGTPYVEVSGKLSRDNKGSRFQAFRLADSAAGQGGLCYSVHIGVHRAI